MPKPPEIREYVDNNQAYADLAAGRIVAVANSMTNIAYVAKQRPDTFAVMQPSFGAKVYYAYCMRKDEDSKTLARCVRRRACQVEQRRTSRGLAEEVARCRNGHAEHAAYAELLMN